MMQRSLFITIIVCLMALPLLTGCDDGSASQVTKSPEAEASTVTPALPKQESAKAEAEDQAAAPDESDSSPADQPAGEEQTTDSNATDSDTEAAPKGEDSPGNPAEDSAEEPKDAPPMRRPFRRPPLPNETVPPPQPRVVRPSATGAASSDGVAEITFDTIKFDIEPGDPFEPEMLTEDIEKLFGKKVRIRGYIYPPFQQTGIKQFVLVRDNMECCFGPGAALYDCVAVDMVDDKTIDYTVRPVAVEGTFRLNEVLGLGGEHLSIFHLDGVRVQ